MVYSNPSWIEMIQRAHRCCWWYYWCRTADCLSRWTTAWPGFWRT